MKANRKLGNDRVNEDNERRIDVHFLAMQILRQKRAARETK
jgi:hypothetical protein